MFKQNWTELKTKQKSKMGNAATTKKGDSSESGKSS